MTRGTTERATAEGDGRALRRSLVGDEAGQSAAEYLGIIVVVAIVIAALVVGISRSGTGNIADDTKAAVCRVGQTSCEPGGNSTGSGGQEQGGGDQGGGDDEGCSGFLGCAWSGVKQVGSGVYNVGKGAVDDVVGIVDLVKDPSKIVDAGKYIWDHPGDALKQLVWDDESGGMWDSGDYGGAIGRTIWNVGSWFIPGVDIGRAGSKIGKLGELGRLADKAADVSKVGRLADDAGALARKAEAAAAKGDKAAAEQAARQARAKADEAEQSAASKGCPIAFGIRPGTGGPPGSVLALGGGARPGAAAVVFRAAPGGCEDATDTAKQADAEADKAEQQAAATVASTTPDIDAASFAQKTASRKFSEDGAFAGDTIDGVSSKLRTGTLTPAEVPVEVIVRDGHTLILNTRSAQALTAAGVPRSSWSVVDKTGDAAAEARLTGQLSRNKLDATGTDTVRITGGGG